MRTCQTCTSNLQIKHGVCNSYSPVMICDEYLLPVTKHGISPAADLPAIQDDI